MAIPPITLLSLLLGSSRVRLFSPYDCIGLLFLLKNEQTLTPVNIGVDLVDELVVI